MPAPLHIANSAASNKRREAYRDQRGVPFVDSLVLDFRFAFRMLAKNPAFALVAILTLALGIGATTAVFSVVDRLLFRSLPYAQDDRLVSFGLTAPIEKYEFVLGAGYVDFRHNPGPFVQIAAMQPGIAKCDLTEPNSIRIDCAHVEQTFLPTLGVDPILGRNFAPDEDRPKSDATMILTYAFWKDRYGGDPSVIGKIISHRRKADADHRCASRELRDAIVERDRCAYPART